MNRESVIKLYERLTALVEKLPGGVQKPILRELVPLRELFLEQRPARLFIVGGAASVSIPTLLRYLCGAQVETGDALAGWRTYRLVDGVVEVLDARLETPEELVKTGLATHRPDAILFLRDHTDLAASFNSAFEVAAACVAYSDDLKNGRLGVTGLIWGEQGETARIKLSALLHSRREFSQRSVHVFSADPEFAEAAAESICNCLPNAAKLEFARVTGARAAQLEIANSLLKSFTAVCGIIGVQPIPLADMPILITLQLLLVSLIIYVSGRRVSSRLIAEFTGVLGINIGAGFAFREGARALLKIFPIWGNAISGIVAGAGTYAMGRAAIAYFIEDLPLRETQKLLRRLQPGFKSFKRQTLPLLTRRATPEKPRRDSE